MSARPAPPARIWPIIVASAVGTMVEWYDFYIFGSLATVISPLFYPRGNDALALIAYLSTFAVGFVVRSFGASSDEHVSTATPRVAVGATPSASRVFSLEVESGCERLQPSR